MKKIYMAGKLFSEADQIQRQREFDKLDKVIKEINVDDDIFTPIHAPVNDKSKLPTARDIFSFDEEKLMEADVIFADLADEDAGVMMELGMVVHKDVKVYAYLPDIRIPTAGNYDGIYVPFGYNQFVIGGLEKYFDKVYLSFDEALEAYKADRAN